MTKDECPDGISLLLEPRKAQDDTPLSVKIEDMTFGYDEKTILENINLEIDHPGLLCILGPNGVGKTTIVKCINKLLKPQKGHVYVNGRDVSEMSLLEVAQILAFVPNSSSSVFSMTVPEAILMGRHPRAGWTTSERDIKVVDAAIDLLGLQEFSTRDIRQLSAGQLQRVLIARGLVQEPDILILDEPTSNLDVKYQMDVMRFLKAYARDRGILVIMVCHDLNITAAYADRVILMYGKGVFADGKPAEVLTSENIKTVYKVNAEVSDRNGVPQIHLIPEYD
ncbi:MAG: ABC transporter ATP-binding protein [Candidatus Methanomethylophilaceae archaeon]|nr:ABC transporter ATP-binding protein [Candidatus Methanomethylophilaceae archaeon]